MSNLQRNPSPGHTVEGGSQAALAGQDTISSSVCPCGAPLVTQSGRGRQRLFCCPAHKQREYRNRSKERRNKTNILYSAHALTVLKTIDDNSVDCLVTDPPYGYSFMGKDWDKVVPSVDIWKECVRVLKPGAFAFIMSAPRQDVLSQMVVRLSEAGFRTDFTSLYWAYASGFPKAANIGKMVDKRNGRNQDVYKPFAEYLKQQRMAKGLSMSKIDELLGTNTAYSWWEGRLSGMQLPTKSYYLQLKQILDLDNRFDELIEREEAEREIIGQKQTGDPTNWYANQDTQERDGLVDITLPATPQAKALDGSYGGFQPKPAVEVILVCMKPLSEKTFVDQTLKNGKGVTWLDDCRIPYDGEIPNMGGRLHAKMGGEQPYGFKVEGRPQQPNYQGRFPANLLVSDNVLNDGRNSRSAGIDNRGEAKTGGYGGELGKGKIDVQQYHDSGSFSRFFDLDTWFAKKLKDLPASVRKTFPYLIVPKASKSEKSKELDNISNTHPTVKPLKLMSYLIILGSRHGDVILDPFMGSGTTCLAASQLGRRYIGIELHVEYVNIARKRVDQAS